MSEYEAYKDSGAEWLGMIPHKWKTGMIGSLYTPRNTKVSDTEYSPLSVTMKGIVPQLDNAAKTDAHDARKLVLKGDFAINSRSDRRGSCGISDYDGSVSLINTVLMPRSSMNPRYYNWLFHTVQFADEYYKNGHGIVDDLWTTRWNEMKRILIPVPSDTEQTAISVYLDCKIEKIDAIISEAEASIEEYKAWKTSIIYEAVTKGINANAELKDSGIAWIGCIPTQWRIGQLGKFISVFNGDRSTNYPTPEEILPEGIPFFTSYDLDYDEVIMHRDGKYLSRHKYESLAGYKAQIGDIIFCLRGSIGKCAINLQYPEGTVASSLMGIRCMSINNKYAFYLLTSSVVGVQNDLLMNGTCAANLSAKNVCTYKIPVPPYDEQKAIAEYLDCKCSMINHLIMEKEALISDLEVYKKSLIFEVVTGKRKVV